MMSTAMASPVRAPRRRTPFDPWQFAAVAIAAVVLLPLLALAWIALQGSDAWAHVAANVVPQAAWNSVRLLFGVGVLTVAIGTGAAWLVTACDFPGRGVMAWALLLPVPAWLLPATLNWVAVFLFSCFWALLLSSPLQFTLWLSTSFCFTPTPLWASFKKQQIKRPLCFWGGLFLFFCFLPYRLLGKACCPHCPYISK